MIHRGALILGYKEPAIRWINEADPSPRGTLHTVENVNKERTVYLISDAAGDNPASFNLFQQSFHPEVHTILIDLVGSELYDDEI